MLAAGVIAGMNVVRIINEPTAAAIAYGLDKRGAQQQQHFSFTFSSSCLELCLANMSHCLFRHACNPGQAGQRVCVMMLEARVLFI